MTLGDGDPDDDDDDSDSDSSEEDGDDDDDDDDDGIPSFLSPTRNPVKYRCCPPSVNVCEGKGRKGSATEHDDDDDDCSECEAFCRRKYGVELGDDEEDEEEDDEGEVEGDGDDDDEPSPQEKERRLNVRERILRTGKLSGKEFYV